MSSDIPINDRELFDKYGIYFATVWSGLYSTNTIPSRVGNMQSYGDSFSNPPDWSNTPINDNKKFIKLEQSFSYQLEQSNDLFDGQNQYSLKEKMKLSTDALLSCYPEKISLELTVEGSIFYTLIKNDIKIYFQHFLIDEFDDSEEAIVSVFKDDYNLLNYAGSLHETISQLGLVLSQNSIVLHQFA